MHCLRASLLFAATCLLPVCVLASTQAVRLDERDATVRGETSGEAAPRPAQLRSRRFDAADDEPKFIRYTETTGWPGGIVHWRYNDSGRPGSIVASSAAALAVIQTAMAKWTAVCNVTFIYDGTSTATPTLVNPSPTFDGVNVVGWQAQSAPQTGVAGIGWSLPEPGPIIEGDVALNNTYNPDLAVTIVHELGHLLGLKHSDVSNVVMSGPPLTSYVAQSNLQADDIAGCVNIYGPATALPTITGTITNGAAGVAGVSFCAQPSAGVSCTASNASGAYSCTVPSGWTGRLHSPMVGSNRIPAQSFANVTSAVTRNVSASSGVPGCNLDVDNNGLFDAATDGVAIMRRMLGFGQSAFAGLAGTCAANTTASAIYAATNASYNAAGYNATGGSATLAATDGEVILRAMLGLTGSAVTNGLGLASEGGASRTSWTNIQSWLNTTCGANF